MLVSTAVDDYSYYILKHSPATQVWYLARLKAFAEWCDDRKLQLEQIRAVEIRRYIEELRTKVSDRTGEKLSSYSVHGHARSIRTFLNWCSKEDGLEDLVSERTIKRIEMPKLDTKIIQIFSDAEIKRLLAACSKEFSPELVARDQALLLVLLDTGARNAEICGLTLEHVFIMDVQHPTIPTCVQTSSR